MTITSGSPAGYIDFTSYGLGEAQLTSLQALDVIWRDAVARVVAANGTGLVFDEFLSLSGELACSISDLGWQQRWMLVWHKLHGQGISLADLLLLFSRAIECCEASLFGEAPQVTRLHLDLFSVLRRSVTAAVSCAIEFGEEARSAESGLPGELAALRAIRELSQAHSQLAVVSLSLVNRNAFAHLAASDLQSLPMLLGARLQELLRAQDRVFSGREDEWLLVLPGIHSMAQPSLAAAHVQRVFDEPVRLVSGRSMVLDVAMGAAMMPEHAGDADAIVHAARLARWDLAAGKRTFGWFHPGLKEDWRNRYELVEELREALHHETLEFFLQPQMVLANEACRSAELLLRWRRENGESLAPSLIIEMIEENGWRAQFTDWLLRYALRTLADLDAAGIEISLSINLTTADLLDLDLPELISQRLETWRIPAGRLTLELTESSMMVNQERCLSIMRQLKAQGLRLALDDFGTGYSSLSYLASLPIDEIKIDRSFTVGMLNSADGLRIVRTIVDLTRDLGKVSLAEGVEDEAQLAQLRSLGCQMVQGYLHAEPMALDAFIPWYQNRHA